MRKISQKEIKLLFLLGMVAIVFFSFRFPYAKNQELIKATEEVNEQLQETLDAYILLSLQKETFETGLVEFKKQVTNMESLYGPGTSPEKSTDFVIRMEEKLGMNVSSISFGVPLVFFTSSQGKGENGEFYEASVTELNLSYTADYESLKEMIDYINTYEERMIIKTISASFDQETGDLTGALALDWYSLSGNGNVYKEPIVTDVELGTSNIFDGN